MVSILCGKAAERDLIKQVFRKIIFVPDRRLLSTNEVRQNMQDQMLAADLLVLLHQEQAVIGLQAAIEGIVVSHSLTIVRQANHIVAAIDICFSMTDIFPSEVFAVVMQRIIDSTSLPLLFMRTVSHSTESRVIMLSVRRKTGFASGYNIQVVGRLRVDHLTFPFDHKEGLDKSAALGGVHEMCEDYCSCQLFRSYATPKGATQGNSG